MSVFVNHIERCLAYSIGIAALPALYGAAKGASEALDSYDRPLVSPNTPDSAVGIEAVASITAATATTAVGALDGLTKGCLWWCLLSIPAAVVAFPVLLVALPIVDAAVFIKNKML